ncbi:hypothetical protein CDL12_26540 [Handroanthus impetiginosus]|uniref:Uncharacterized protein n=1 Tax=Handroanthus impetiginosus TaxID=429701 RepID=A0A2G9G6L1_9LAMI|nr:hypothetical protein CDL12_26540 [Handroanthus impetiginosus]
MQSKLCLRFFLVLNVFQKNLNDLPPSFPINTWLHKTHRRKQNSGFIDHSVDKDELLSFIVHELYALMSLYKSYSLSIRFVISVLSHKTEWQRSFFLLDFMNEETMYTPSVLAYNVVSHNVLWAKQWKIVYGLFDEM